MIEYPSAVFSLEAHEIYPYERFAYNALRTGTEALHEKGLSESILISFLSGADSDKWWAFNAGIGDWVSKNGDFHGYRVSTTPIVPLFVFGVCHVLAPLLFDENEQKSTFASPEKFTDELQRFGNVFTDSLKKYREKGLASAIRNLYEEYSISVLDVERSRLRYDLCTRFITKHEIAHAYVGQLSKEARSFTHEESRAFEYIVDLVAMQWIYNAIILNTPDSQEYRKIRGTEDHAESVLVNAYSVNEAQILVFLLFALGSALNNKGTICLDGGLVHPNSLVRHLMQYTHFTTLMLSNWEELVGAKELSDLAEYSNQYLGLFAEVGLLSLDDAKALVSPNTIQDHKVAEKLVDEFQVTELFEAKGIFRSAEKLKGREKMK